MLSAPDNFRYPRGRVRSGLKDRIRGGARSVGSWLTIPAPAVAEIMAAAGFDWLVVDLEHSALSLSQAADLIRVIDRCGSAPLVRLSALDPTQIKRVMDAGAHGIIVPMVCEAEQVRAAERAMHYPPRGQRGVGLARAQGYGVDFDAYRSWLDAEALLIAQIEHVDALPNLDAIFASPALDAFLIGPYDLSASMGVAGQLDDPEVDAALTQILDAGRRAGLAAGIHVVEPNPDRLQARLTSGFTFVAYSVDFRMLDHAARSASDLLR